MLFEVTEKLVLDWGRHQPPLQTLSGFVSKCLPRSGDKLEPLTLTIQRKQKRPKVKPVFLRTIEVIIINPGIFKCLQRKRETGNAALGS